MLSASDHAKCAALNILIACPILSLRVCIFNIALLSLLSHPNKYSDTQFISGTIYFVSPQCIFHVDEDSPRTFNNTLVNSSYILVVFSIFQVVAAAAVPLTITTPDESDIPRDVWKRWFFT